MTLLRRNAIGYTLSLPTSEPLGTFQVLNMLLYRSRSVIKDDVAQVSTSPQLRSDMQEEMPETDGEKSERMSRIVRFVFSHALANSVKVRSTGKRTCGEVLLQLGSLEAQLMAIAGSGNRSLAAINDALTKGRVLISKKEALMSLASLTSIR